MRILSEPFLISYLFNRSTDNRSLVEISVYIARVIVALIIVHPLNCEHQGESKSVQPPPLSGGKHNAYTATAEYSIYTATARYGIYTATERYSIYTATAECSIYTAIAGFSIYTATTRYNIYTATASYSI